MLLETIKYGCRLIHFDKHFMRPVCRNVKTFCGSFVENMRQYAYICASGKTLPTQHSLQLQCNHCYDKHMAGILHKGFTKSQQKCYSADTCDFRYLQISKAMQTIFGRYFILWNSFFDMAHFPITLLILKRNKIRMADNISFNNKRIKKAMHYYILKISTNIE